MGASRPAIDYGSPDYGVIFAPKVSRTANLPKGGAPNRITSGANILNPAKSGASRKSASNILNTVRSGAASTSARRPISGSPGAGTSGGKATTAPNVTAPPAPAPGPAPSSSSGSSAGPSVSGSSTSSTGGTNAWPDTTGAAVPNVGGMASPDTGTTGGGGGLSLSTIGMVAALGVVVLLIVTKKGKRKGGIL